MTKDLLTIQEAAKELGLSTKTLRRWEKRGILAPQRTKGNQRRYTKEEISDLKLRTKDLKYKIQPPQNLGNKIQQLAVIEPLDLFSQIKLEVGSLSSSKRKIIFSFAGIFTVLLLAVIVGRGTKILGENGFFGKDANSSPSRAAFPNNQGAAVLGASVKPSAFLFGVNVPSLFNKNATFNKDLIVKGKITSPSLIYSINAGTGLSVSAGQNPTIINTGVTSLGGSTGAIDLTGGSGISISGLTITNSDLGSSQDIFKNFDISGSTITAGSNSDTLNFSAGTGISLSADTSGKTITISSSGSSSTTVTGWTASGTNVILTTATDFVGIGTSTPSANLDVTGTGYIRGASGQTGLYVGSTGNVGIGTTTTSAGALTVAGDIVPSSTSVYNLGSSSLMWDNIYANQIVGTQQSIDLNVPATSSATGLSVSMTGSGSGQLASFTFNGTQVLGVGTNDVFLGGKVSQLTDDTNLANAADVFVYNTTNDSDGGQWINSDLAQSSSWYNETISATGLNCSLAAYQRCGQRQFPQKVTIYVTSHDIYIFDNKDNTMWMKFSEGTGYAINGTSVNLTSVFALNGVLYVGTSINGLLEINFITDKIYQFDYNGGSGGRAQFLGTISQRNSDKGYGARSSWGQIASDQVNGVFARLINGKTYIAASTLGGVSIIDLSDQKVVKYVDK